jgi:hypothetical protein
MIYCISTYIDDDSKTTMKSMASYVSKDTECQIVDLKKESPPKYSAEDILFIFGDVAEKLLGVTSNNPIKFPRADELDPTYGNPEVREEVYKKLKDIKPQLDKKISTKINGSLQQGSESPKLGQVGAAPTFRANPEKITAENLPELTSSTILKLMKNKEWIGTTQDGKSIRLTVEQEDKDKVDIQMTFIELYMLRLAIEVLQVKSFEIAYKDNS